MVDRPYKIQHRAKEQCSFEPAGAQLKGALKGKFKSHVSISS
jgi:hypothetical protein